jgi:hypothetical protein
MTAYGAIIRKHKTAFAVVRVKSSVAASMSETGKALATYEAFFPGMPLVLATEGEAGAFEYHGAPALTAVLASMDPWEIPWREYPRSER